MGCLLGEVGFWGELFVVLLEIDDDVFVVFGLMFICFLFFFMFVILFVVLILGVFDFILVLFFLVGVLLIFFFLLLLFGINVEFVIEDCCVLLIFVKRVFCNGICGLL